jgi:hypothetical protein
MMHKYFRHAWDLAVDTCLSQLHDVVKSGKIFQVTLFSNLINCGESILAM